MTDEEEFGFTMIWVEDCWIKELVTEFDDVAYGMKPAVNGVVVARPPPEPPNDDEAIKIYPVPLAFPIRIFPAAGSVEVPVPP